MDSNVICASERSSRWPRRSGLIALVLALVLLGACGGSENERDDANNNNKPVVNNPNNVTAPSCDEPQLLKSADVNGGVTLAKGCYTVESRITVNDGVLTLEPGVSIVFSKDAGFSFSGTGAFAAVGTSEEQIFLTGSVQEQGHWRGLYFEKSNSPSNKLDFVVLSHAGGSKWHGGVSSAGIFIEGDSNRLHISNSTFTHNLQTGILAKSGGADFKLESSHFSDNESPLWIHSNLIGNLSELSFKDNAKPSIRTGLVAETIGTAQTWPVFEVPYRVANTLKVGAALTLAPGVVLEFEQDFGMAISGEGRFIAKGTEDKMITLTGVEKQRGFWRGLHFEDTKSSANALDYVVVEYAGAAKWHGGASSGGLFLEGSGVALAISNSVFRENAVAGIFSTGIDADVTVASTSFENNKLPIWMADNLIGGLAADNAFDGNDESYVLVGNGSGPRTNVTKDQTWVTLPVPYRVELTVLVKGNLTLSPGMTIEFKQGKGIYVDEGTLAADATDGDRIRFIAADGETGQGFWAGIGFTKSFSNKNIIANADILYGGGAGWNGLETSWANLYATGGRDKAQVAVNNVKIAGSGGYGISAGTDSAVSPCENVTFENNTKDDITGAGASTCN